MDGPLSDAQLTGLELPVRGRFGNGGFVFGEGCTPTAFQSLVYGSLRLGATRLALCPLGRGLIWMGPSGSVQGGARIGNLALSGRLGTSPLGLAARNFRFDLARSDFASGAIAIRLGSQGFVNRLELAALTGRITDTGVVGSYSGGAGKIANVPLLLSDARGRWQIAGGKTTVDGGMTVSDESNPSRFFPLKTDDFHLVLDGNRLDAGAWLNDPEKGVRIAHATIIHGLDNGSGRAELEVPGITFGENYQPEDLTSLTTGVVALVEGTLTGRGEIAWSPQGTTSSGTFSTEKTNLAAAFGPIKGLKTTINFTDLLGLATAPGQLATVDLVQAGIDVFDGEIRYQLLPGLKVRVESGRWPFAGGELALEETILDFSQPSEKRLTFRVTGIDAAAFVQQMQFSNISATGTFDGVVPMVFDARGGRIVNGHLAARPGGGVVSYVGELSDQQLGAYGKLAFNALKSLGYKKLTIDLDGALEGEFVAGVELDGIARNTASPGGIAGHVLSQVARIPLEFNITARGPFRAIIGTMRSMKDPTGLIQAVLPTALRDQPASTIVQPASTTLQPAATTVQPEESETVQ
jgi:hypothetical protein